MIRNPLLLAIALSFFSTQVLFHRVLSAQETEARAQVALVDVAYIFKNYKKFDALIASLRETVEQSDTHAQSQLEQMRALQAQLEAGTLVPGSPEQTQLEKKLIAMQSQLQARRVVDQRDFQQKEAEIYKTVYLEVSDAVSQYARHYRYTLVLQFSRPDFENAGSPREILDQLNTPIIYYSKSDDISEPILQYLNNNWTQRQTSSGSATPASGTSPGP